MSRYDYFKKVVKGGIYALVTTIILVFILSFLMTYIDISRQATSILYIIITCISIFFGTVYSAKTINKKGWLIGMLVGIVYMFCLCLIYVLLNQGIDFNSKDFIRIVLAILVGAFSGMLGVNV